MSVSLILIPTALAVAAAVGGTGLVGAAAQSRHRTASDDEPAAPVPVDVRTRMKDRTLLGAALEDLGAVEVVVDDRITGLVDGIRIEMTRDPDGIWGAHLAADDGSELNEEEAADLVRRLDGAYARRVQQTVADRIRQRADGAGFDLVSETRDEDDAVTMVLNVREGR